MKLKPDSDSESVVLPRCLLRRALEERVNFLGNGLGLEDSDSDPSSSFSLTSPLLRATPPGVGFSILARAEGPASFFKGLHFFNSGLLSELDSRKYKNKTI